MGLGRSKTYDLVRSGVIKTVKVGGRTLIPAEELIKLLNQGGQ
ncbi:hypothetical protein ABAC402_17785 [Asticcacaulis sp. AC402]|nr:hypothetical protein ABAC402_17785 [Asticcacaulis sp. AC402]